MAVELAKQLRDHTKADALHSYQELVEAIPASPDALTIQDARRMGLPTLDHFFLHHRIKVKTRSHLSFYDAIKDPVIKKRLTELVVRYKKKPLSDYDKQGLLKTQYQVFQLYYGSINQFRPIVAKWVYLHFKPKRGVLDFSAGWGGRALAAMSLGIPYIGIDANVRLAPAYRQMIAAVDPSASVQLFFQPAETVDFSQFHGKYDLIFTSPPYFMIEEYEKMPAYKTKEGFLQIFFVPTVMSAWKHLVRGHMALNMPEEMYEAIRPHLPKIVQTIKMPLSNRHPTNASKRQTLGQKDKSREELIYVWRKV